MIPDKSIGVANSLRRGSNATQTDAGSSLYTASDSSFIPSNNSSFDNSKNSRKYTGPVLALLGIIAFAVSQISHNYDIPALIDKLLIDIENLGPYSYMYFALAYILAEIVGVPAFPLTASSGYLFGIGPGLAIVLLSAAVAASFSFFVGRTFLRGWVQELAESSKEWRAVDKAVEREGFKVVLLLRLSPLLPFALSNYLYGITSVDYWSFIAATVLGFTPGTFAIVYAGTAGKAIFSEDGSGLPWYAYAAGLGMLIFFGKTIATVATDAIRRIEEEDNKKI